MTNIVTLDEVKYHLRVDLESEDEDAHITLFMGAAQDYVRNFLNSDIPDSPVPDAIRAAVLLIVGDLYKNREATTDAQTYRNPAVDNLLYPYRVSIGI